MILGCTSKVLRNVSLIKHECFHTETPPKNAKRFRMIFRPSRMRASIRGYRCKQWALDAIDQTWTSDWVFYTWICYFEEIIRPSVVSVLHAEIFPPQIQFKSDSLGPDSISRYHLTSIGNSIVEIRRFYDRVISTRGIPILVR